MCKRRLTQPLGKISIDKLSVTENLLFDYKQTINDLYSRPDFRLIAEAAFVGFMRIRGGGLNQQMTDVAGLFAKIEEALHENCHLTE